MKQKYDNLQLMIENNCDSNGYGFDAKLLILSLEPDFMMLIHFSQVKKLISWKKNIKRGIYNNRNSIGYRWTFQIEGILIIQIGNKIGWGFIYEIKSERILALIIR
jgi:hypothetical protein